MEVNKTLCQCGKCHSWFEYKDNNQVNLNVYHIQVKDSTCPKCGFKGFTMVQHERYLSKFDNTNDFYY